MRREIKYRAWDKKHKGYINGFNMYGFSTGQGAPKRTLHRFSDEWNMEDVELMQYTGLKDKNGKEIYEGDIYHQGDKNILYVVAWHDTGLTGKQIRANSYAGLGYWKERIKVIGNIYENPNLLDQEDNQDE